MERRRSLPARLLLVLVVTLAVDRQCSAHAARVARQTGGLVSLCTTEDGLEGICTALRACPPMDRLLQLIKRRRATAAQSDRLRQETFKCPFSGAARRGPRVCCADATIVAPPDTATPRTTLEETLPATAAPVTPAPVTAAPVTSAPVTPAPTPLGPTDLNKFLRESVCGQKTFLSRIFGGQRAEIGSWPWVGSIGYNVTGRKEIQWRCGATLISSRHVLTAAHCIHRQTVPGNTRPAMVRLGELDFNTDPDCMPSDRTQCADSFRDVPIESIHPHDQYKAGAAMQGRFGNAFEHDIAVLRLTESVEPYTDFIRPICLPVDLTRLAGRTDDKAGQRAYIIGWGRSDEFSFDDFTPELQEATIRLVARSQCEKTYNRSLTDGFGSRLCAGQGQGVDTCRGDSGGPLMTSGPHGTHWYLTGITSFGSETCGIREAVYTRVHDYLDWIGSFL